MLIGKKKTICKSLLTGEKPFPRRQKGNYFIQLSQVKYIPPGALVSSDCSLHAAVPLSFL